MEEVASVSQPVDLLNGIKEIYGADIREIPDTLQKFLDKAGIAKVFLGPFIMDAGKPLINNGREVIDEYFNGTPENTMTQEEYFLNSYEEFPTIMEKLFKNVPMNGFAEDLKFTTQIYVKEILGTLRGSVVVLKSHESV